MVPPVPEITVEELNDRRDRGDDLVLLDVREPHEILISELPGSVQIPLGQLPQSLNRLSKENEIVVFCRVGGRSANAVEFLRQMGYEKAVNRGGCPRKALLRAGDALAARGMLEQVSGGGPGGPPNPLPLVRRSSALPLSRRPRRARDGPFSDSLLAGGINRWAERIDPSMAKY